MGPTMRPNRGGRLSASNHNPRQAIAATKAVTIDGLELRVAARLTHDDANVAVATRA